MRLPVSGAVFSIIANGIYPQSLFILNIKKVLFGEIILKDIFIKMGIGNMDNMNMNLN
jgi:hypothetical protein